MWRTVTGDRGNSGARASPASAPELSSLGLYPQDSPLLGLLSAVSRPAVSFLQRWSPFVPGRALKQDLMEQQSEFLPPQPLHSLSWFDLSELGIHSPDDPNRPEDSGLQAQTVVSHVLVHPPRAASNPWLGALWSEDERLKSAGAGLLTAAFIHERGLSPAPGLGPALIHSLGLNALAPDPDNGYSSLEEEQLLAAKAQLLQSAWTGPAEEEEEEAVEEEEEAVEEVEEVEVEEEVPVLKCDNKAIAFIMGCPCSDDSGSDSSEDEDDEDDDGFDSDGSSDVSDSDDEEEEFDSEAERLWSTLCQNHDPYNPRNFTAKLGSAPRPIPNIPRAGVEPGTSTSASSPYASSPSSCASSCASSSSWDEASEVETEGEKLLAAFRSSDPYSPLNFQASIRTKPRPDPELEPELRVRTSSESSHRSSRTSNNSKKKKVRFLAEVRVFAVGCEERCGPWEELARDRARFAKRCSETELVLSSCLQREHRRRVYLRLCQSESEE